MYIYIYHSVNIGMFCISSKEKYIGILKSWKLIDNGIVMFINNITSNKGNFTTLAMRFEANLQATFKPMHNKKMFGS